MNMNREEYCDPSNRERIANEYPFMLDYFDSYCSSTPCVIDNKLDPSSKPNNINIDTVWIIAIILFIIIIAIGMMML